MRTIKIQSAATPHNQPGRPRRLRILIATLALAALSAPALHAQSAGAAPALMPGLPPPPPAPLQIQKEQIDHILAQADGAARDPHSRHGGARKLQFHAAHDPFRGDRIPTPLLVLTSTPDQEMVAQLREDLAVMSRILDKNVKEIASSSSFTAMGINLLTFPGTRPARNVYIEDYGVIFTLRVNMPLLAPDTAAESAQDDDQPVDTAWEEAKSEILGQTFSRGKNREDRPPQYDAHSVEELKKMLVATLRNATNIRNLSGSDSVTIVVTGQPAGGPARHEFDRALRFQFDEVFFWDDADGPSTTMVVRAKKADIDEFAKSEKRDLESFKSKVTIATY